MSYQALYRVYRPQRFGDISGQHAITQTLKNAIAENKTSHAYLFTGPRGTGKTSAAKIFAKAINCPNQSEGEPCNDCEIRQDITNGSLNDVIEIDAASNNGVEEIRDIREKANYAPTRAEHKVYIIDEVHMLSQGAFNALLKTLEEPPKNVIFILATTEPHKIPLTIISRTQRFDFKRLTNQDIIDRMRYVLDEEAIDFEPEALDVIAQTAEGGMRDALSILDQAISFSEGIVTVDVAMQVTGSLTQQNLLQYVTALYEKNTEEALRSLQDILGEGKDPARFAEDVILFCRDIIVYKETPGHTQLLKRAKADDAFLTLSERVENDELYTIIQIFNEAQHELRLSNHAPVYLEVATVRLSQKVNPAREQALAEPTAQNNETQLEVVKELESQLLELQKDIKKLQQGQTTAATNTPKQTVRPKPQTKRASGGVSFKPNRTAIYNVLEKATREDLSETQVLWPELQTDLTVTQRAVIKASSPVAASGDGVVVSFEYDILCQKATDDQELIDAIADYIEKVTKRRPQLVFVTQSQWPKIRQDFIDQLRDDKSVTGQSESEVVKEENQKQAKVEKEENKIVDEATNMFGEEVVQVKDE